MTDDCAGGNVVLEKHKFGALLVWKMFFLFPPTFVVCLDIMNVHVAAVGSWTLLKVNIISTSYTRYSLRTLHQMSA